jgi:hypothetical protein
MSHVLCKHVFTLHTNGEMSSLESLANVVVQCSKEQYCNEQQNGGNRS